MAKKNYIDDKGNYQNVENLTLAQIYNEGVKAGIAISKMIKSNQEDQNGDNNQSCKN